MSVNRKTKTDAANRSLGTEGDNDCTAIKVRLDVSVAPASH
jgi:hypothetical protein